MGRGGVKEYELYSYGGGVGVGVGVWSSGGCGEL